MSGDKKKWKVKFKEFKEFGPHEIVTDDECQDVLITVHSALQYLPRRIIAAVNATTGISIEELERSGLAEHDAEVCRLQREACIARFDRLPNGEYHPSTISRMIRDTPVPEAKEMK